ncbi:MAG: NAD(P)/FAD-dependent oxidoreductase [Acidobacteriota bacterium]
MNTTSQLILPMDANSEATILHSKPERFRVLDHDCFDVIVVGAGTGGLTTAALLARRGYKVLVLDRHYVVGGNATVFHRPGYQFDVGLHYLGDCGPNGSIPRILHATGIDDIIFRELDPDGFDTLVFPDFTFPVPKGIENFRERLITYFPKEEQGINRYIDLLHNLWSLQGIGNGFLHTLRLLWQARRVFWYRNITLKEFLDTCTTDKRLSAVLAAQSGLYAQPPSRASLMVHAFVTMSYLTGAYYPIGGAQVISDRLAQVIEQHKGKILLMSEVTRIIVENGHVTGVELKSPHLGKLIVHASVVISDADLKHTLLDLVGPAYLRDKTVQNTRAYQMSPAFGVVFLGIQRDLQAEGVPNTNYWIHPNYDQEQVYIEACAGRFYPKPFCYVSIATLKDPDNPKLAPPGVTNMELMTIVPSQPEAWGSRMSEIINGTYRNNLKYIEMKEALAARLLNTVESVFPSISKQVVFQEVASPMTHTRFTGSTGGSGYGIALIPSQFLLKRPSSATEIKGLFLCGASTVSGHGIAGTMWSGVLAASRLAGMEILKDVRGKL